MTAHGVEPSAVRHVLAELDALERAKHRGRLLPSAAAEFGPRFVELARSVYRLNDERGALKRRISELCGSAWVEQQQYGRPRG